MLERERDLKTTTLVVPNVLHVCEHARFVKNVCETCVI